MKRIDTTSTHYSLWVAFLCGPIAWTAHELLSYVFVRPACNASAVVLEYAVTILALALVAAGAYLARRPRPAGATSDFVSATALLLNALFAFAIVMEAIPNLVVNPCL